MEPMVVLLNARVYTMDEKKPIVEAVALCGNQILAVGDTSEIQKMAGSDTMKVDLQGRTVLPGMTDAHVHLLSYAVAAGQIDLDGARTVSEALRRVEAKAKTAGEGEWLLGRGWDRNLWSGGRLPKKGDLDRVAKDNPVALTCKDGHVTWVNSPALGAAGVTRETEQPVGGEIEKDPETGEPTGILRETAQETIAAVIPQPSFESLIEAATAAIARFQSLGITAVSDCEDAAAFSVFQTLLDEGRLGLRISVLIPADALDAAVQMGIQSGFGDEKLRIAGVKILADGSLGSQTAAMLEPYEGNPENKGILRLTEKELNGLVSKATSHGISVAVHSIGDRANKIVLNVFQRDQRKAKQRGRVRYRAEHAQHLTQIDVRRLGRLGVVASMQPFHIALDMDTADRHLGRRARWSYPFRSLLDSGAILAFGSDAPVADHNPIAGIYTAVTRSRGPHSPEGGWYPEERISVEEAVRAYTVGGAYAAGEEELRGTITPGKLADIVVLSRDIFRVPVDEIRQVEVEMTIFDGRVVYQRDPCSFCLHA